MLSPAAKTLPSPSQDPLQRTVYPLLGRWWGGRSMMKGDTTMTTIRGNDAAIFVGAAQSFHCSHQLRKPPSFVMEG
jgi:hypothetical protein